MATPRKVTEKQAEEFRKCMGDVVYFVTRYCYLRHTTKGKIRWDKPYDFQLKLLRALQDGEDVFVLKSRRIGASWTVCAFVLWLVMFKPDLTALLLSRKEFYAKGLLRRIKFILKNLPVWMRPKLKKDSESELIFEFVWQDEVAESNIISLTTTDESGRGEDAAIVFFDEAAFVDNADDVWGSIGPTASFGGQRVVCSTPNGVGGFFHRVIMQLQALQEIGIDYIEAHWKRDCGLSDEWFAKATVGLSTQKILQEFELQFLSSGRPFFDLVKIDQCYKPLSKFPQVASLMQKTQMSFMGVDTSEGHMVVDGEPDYHSICILNEMGVQIFAFNDNRMPRAQFMGHVTELDDGQRVKIEGVPTKLHREYPGICAIEVWGSGDVAANMHEVPQDGFSDLVEFRTTNSSKMRVLNSLRLAINELHIVITDHFTYQCLRTFEDQSTGAVEKAGAAKGGFDDPVISLALAYAQLKRHGGFNLDLSGATTTIDGRRVIGMDGSSDLSPQDLAEALPVGRMAFGPMTGKELAREDNRRMTDAFDDIRSGRSRMRPPGMY